MFPTTIHIKYDWWEPQDRRIVSAATAATTILALTTTEPRNRIHKGRWGGKTLPPLPIPNESGLSPNEPPTPVTPRHLLVHQEQGRGSESHRGGATATHVDHIMLTRRGARHRNPESTWPWKPPHHQKKEKPQVYRPRRFSAAANADNLHHAGGTKIPSAPISHQESGHAVQEVEAPEDILL